MELGNKTIIVTGASSGIGEAAAFLFADEGAQVVLGARREPELSGIADRILQAGGQAAYLAGDVTDRAYAQALVALAQSEFGKLDAAFNNAGTVGDLVPVEDMAEENWRHVIETNLTACFLSARAQIPALRRNGGGSVVFTGSFVGISNGGLPGMAAYAASKAGLAGLTQSLASQHAAEGIRVNALLPGGTMTPMAGDDPEGHAFVENLHPMKRMAAPKEVAQAAMFLLSDRASFMTGSRVLADGGISVRLA